METKSVLNIQRYDASKDQSLRAWSAADELIVSHIQALDAEPKNLLLHNDRFGYLSCYLHYLSPTVVLHKKSQENAVALNLGANELSEINVADPISNLESPADVVALKMPKSLDLFQLFLAQIHQNSTEDVKVICGFMTKHFSAGMLKIAEKYFSSVEQSKAVKKARVLTLSGKIADAPAAPINNLEFNGTTYKQYAGVFSADHIDYGTQFLLEHLKVKDDQQRILDLGSGNGVIAAEILKKHADKEVHLLDESYLAIESGKLNISSENAQHHCADDLSEFVDDSLDLVVTNPPFHFEHEVNIEVTLGLFRDCARVLKSNGELWIVSNKHINYASHLKHVFFTIKTLAENDKFEVLVAKNL